MFLPINMKENSWRFSMKMLNEIWDNINLEMTFFKSLHKKTYKTWESGSKDNYMHLYLNNSIHALLSINNI